MGEYVGLEVGISVRESVVGFDVGKFDGMNVGIDEVGSKVVGGDVDGGLVAIVTPAVSQTVSLYVAVVGNEMQSAFDALKNPISFHVGLIDVSNPSHT